MEPQFHEFISGNNKDQMQRNLQYEKELALQKERLINS